MENVVKTLSLAIQPFHCEQQIEFLERYWLLKYGIETTPSVSQFARNIVDTVGKNFQIHDTEIAGIPLQCSLLGEIYAEDAVDYANSSLTAIDVSVDLHSINDMFNELLNLRLKHITRKEKKQMLVLHSFVAINLLFPKITKPFEFISVDPEMIHRIGLIRSTGSFPETNFQYNHRSCAEYVLARYLVKCLLTCSGKEIKYLQEILPSALMVKRSHHEVEANSLGKTLTLILIYLFCLKTC